MVEIPVFKAEADVNLAKLVRANTHITSLCKLLPSDPVEISKLELPAHAQAGANEQILHYLKTVLVSTVWNLNDDVFEPLETWAARKTPEDTPFNLVHQPDQIIGHVIGNYVVDDEGNVVADDTTADNLPAKFHIVTPAVLYKCWNKPELQERMDNLLAEIAKGDKWYVSMECYFRGFDYALKDKDNNVRVIARNEKTAFLTKHLRAYGGTGEYDNQKVGRVLRNIVFSGKGLVENPGNPESVILAQAIISEIKAEKQNSVYSTVVKTEGKQKMTIEIEKQLEQAKVEIEGLKTQLRENDTKAIKAQLDSEIAKLKDLSEVHAKLVETEKQNKAKLDELQTQVASKEDELKQSLANLEKVQQELDGIKLVAKQAERLNKVKAALKVTDADVEDLKRATALADSLKDLADEKFGAVLASMPPLPPKSTPAQPTPKSTNKPAPMSGKAELETAKPVVEPAVAVAPDDGAETVRLSVASLFGYNAEK